MNIRRKALSVGMSAALLASVIATAAAPAVFAASTGFAVTGAGAVATDGVSGAVSIAVTENGVAGWAVGTNTMTFTITDSAGNGSPTVKWSGTPVISGQPGSLTGITASKATNVLTVTFSNSNASQAENFTVSGMTITTAGAAPGAIRMVVAATAGGFSIPSGTGLASGVLDADYGSGSSTVGITQDSGSDNFAVSDANNGSLMIAAPDAESIAITATDGSTYADFANPPVTANFHAAGTVVTQNVSVGGLLGSPATVAATLYTNAENGITTVLPGENNQQVDTAVEVGEPTAGTLKAGTVVTFTIDTPGVLFSASPDFIEIGGDIVLTSDVCALSFDRKSCSVTVKTKSTVADAWEQIEIEEGYSFDVAANVPLGTKIGINVTTNQAGLPIVQNPNGSDDMTVAVVGRVIVGTAAAPTIWINYNDQSTGQITLTESAAGFFTGGATNNNFEVCIDGPESFTRAPWAVVTAGDLKLRSGVVGATSVQGVFDGTDCIYWTVYTASTVASTIEIRGSDASNVVLPSGALNGPRLSVPGSADPGPTIMDVYTGEFATSSWDFTGSVTNAIRAYKSGVVVTAASQPAIASGSTGHAGDIVISETLNGQFQNGETIECDILAPANTENQQTYLASATSNGLPIVTGNSAASGLIAHLSNWWNDGFQLRVDQRAFAPALGVITISNLTYTNVSGATSGAITVECYKSSGSGVDFDAFVSNATVGNPAPLTFNLTGTALGNTLTGPFTPSTKISTGGYITWKFDGGAAVAGKTIQIWAYKKVALFTNPWSAAYLLTTRVADANGIAYANINSHSVIWLSIRPVLPASGSMPAVWGSWSIGRWIH